MMEKSRAGEAIRGVNRGRLRVMGVVSYNIYLHGYINITLGPWQKNNKVGWDQGDHGGRCK